MKDVYVITGGGGGIGMGVARRFAPKGALLLADVKQDSLDKIATELKSQQADVETLVCDVTDPASVEALAAKAKSMGRLAALVHTAGLSPTMGDAQKVMKVNLIGTALIYQAFDPLFGKGCVVVTISSSSLYYMDLIPGKAEVEPLIEEPLAPDFMEKITPYIPDSNMAYPISKYGVYRYSQKLSMNLWREKETRIVTVAPGNVDTSLARQELQSESAGIMRRSIEITPLGRMGDPDEVAKVVEFLCGDGASFITGVDILIDGGMLAMVFRDFNGVPTPGLIPE